jgi:hypothetical protein
MKHSGAWSREMLTPALNAVFSQCISFVSLPSILDFPSMNKMVKAHQSVQIQVAADPLAGVFKPCFVLKFNRLYDLR